MKYIINLEDEFGIDYQFEKEFFSDEKAQYWGEQAIKIYNGVKIFKFEKNNSQVFSDYREHYEKTNVKEIDKEILRLLNKNPQSKSELKQKLDYSEKEIDNSIKKLDKKNYAKFDRLSGKWKFQHRKYNVKRLR